MQPRGGNKPDRGEEQGAGGRRQDDVNTGGNESRQAQKHFTRTSECRKTNRFGRRFEVLDLQESKPSVKIPPNPKADDES